MSEKKRVCIDNFIACLWNMIHVWQRRLPVFFFVSNQCITPCNKNKRVAAVNYMSCEHNCCSLPQIKRADYLWSFVWYTYNSWLCVDDWAITLVSLHTIYDWVRLGHNYCLFFFILLFEYESFSCLLKIIDLIDFLHLILVKNAERASKWL